MIASRRRRSADFERLQIATADLRQETRLGRLQHIHPLNEPSLIDAHPQIADIAVRTHDERRPGHAQEARAFAAAAD